MFCNTKSVIKNTPLNVVALLIFLGCYKENLQHNSKQSKQRSDTEFNVDATSDVKDKHDSEFDLDTGSDVTDSSKTSVNSSPDSASVLIHDAEDTDSSNPIDSQIERDVEVAGDSETRGNECKLPPQTGFQATQKYKSPCSTHSTGTLNEETVDTLTLYSYDDIGDLTKETVCRDGEFSYEIQHIYDEDKKLVREEKRRYDEGPADPTSMVIEYGDEYIYDDYGRLIRNEGSTVETSSYPSSSIITYEYDDTGKLVKEEKVLAGYGTTRSIITYNYNQLEQLESIHEESSSSGRGVISQWIINTVYTYDVHGNRIEEYFEDSSYSGGPFTPITWPPLETWLMSTIIREWTYTYDEDGNMLSKTLQNMSSTSGITYFFEKNVYNTYDKHGNLLSSESEYSSGDTQRIIYTYVCWKM